MVFYSTKSNEKVFHLPHCKIARRIRQEHNRYALGGNLGHILLAIRHHFRSHY